MSIRYQRTIGSIMHLGMLLVLAHVLCGCDSGIVNATAPSSPNGSPSPRLSPTIEATVTNAVFSPTPIARTILTPLPTSGIIPSATKPACIPLGTPSTLPYPGRVGQIWYAEQIVIGNVVAQETRWEINGGYQIITTYSLFHVEERVRGVPLSEILIEQRGGTIDGCTQQNSERLLDRDRQLLLFLKRYDTGKSGTPTYYVMFDSNGVYTVTDTIAGTPTAQFVADMRQILSQPPPANLSNYWIIPLDRAPIAPLPEATPRR